MANYPDISTTAYGGRGAAGSQQTAANTFVPKQWADEMLMQREVNLILASKCMRINFVGKKGDTLEIPFFSDLSAVSHTAGVAVTPQVNAEGKKSLIIDTHMRVPVQLDGDLERQSKYNLREPINQKMGYALAKAQEDSIWTALIAALSSTYKVAGGDGKTSWSNAGAGNGTALSDTGLLRMIQTLDDNLVPDDGKRFMILPPVAKRNILSLDKFTLVQNIGDNKGIRNGMLGDYYGIPTFMSSNCPEVTAADGTTKYRVGIMGHRDAIVSAVQLNVKFETQYKLEYDATLMVADVVYGVKALRTDDDDTTASNHRKSHAILFYVPVE